MNEWVSENDPTRQMLLAAGCTLAGALLTFGFRDFGGIRTNAGAGFLLGILLLIIGVWNILASGRQKVVVDPRARRIVVDDSNLLRTTQRTIPFSDIVSVGIGYMGKKSNNVVWYYLVLRLKNGEEYPLFSPGRFFKGGTDRAVVEGWKQRLEEYLR